MLYAKTIAAVTEPVPVQIAAVEPIVVPITGVINLSGEALFAFDKSVLRPEGKVLLNSLVLHHGVKPNTTYEDISVNGHKDRIGSSEYNQKLSDAVHRQCRITW